MDLIVKVIHPMFGPWLPDNVYCRVSTSSTFEMLERHPPFSALKVTISTVQLGVINHQHPLTLQATGHVAGLLEPL